MKRFCVTFFHYNHNNNTSFVRVDQLRIGRDNSKMVGGMSNVDSGSDPLTTDSNQSEKSAASNPDGKVGQKQIAQDAINHPK